MSGVIRQAQGIAAGSIGGRRFLTLKRALAALAAGLGHQPGGRIRRAVLAGRPVSGLDRRCLCPGRLHHHRAARCRATSPQVLVTDNQPVKAGQVLARIDDRDLRTALDQAAADRQAAENKIANIAAQLDLQQSVIEQAGSAARLRRGRADLRRAGPETLQRAGAHRRRQRAAGAADPVAAAAAHRRPAARPGRADQRAPAGRGAADAPRPRRRSALQHAGAVEQQARLNLCYATITAPEDGTVGARSLRVGQYVQAGTQLMAIVPLHSVYVVANYKETQLTDVRPASRWISVWIPSPARRCTAWWTASRRPAARSSRCCRRTTPPATSPRSSSASR